MATSQPNAQSHGGAGSPSKRRLRGKTASWPDAPEASNPEKIRRLRPVFDDAHAPGHEEEHADDDLGTASVFMPPPTTQEEGKQEMSLEPGPADGEKPPENLSVLDQAYTLLSEVPLDQDEVSKGLGDDCWDWMKKLQGALQMPWETIFFGLISIVTFGLANVTAQYTSMLSVPPLPFLGVAGRPGEAKSVLVWFIKAVMMELQRRDGGEDVLEPDEPDADVEEADESDKASCLCIFRYYYRNPPLKHVCQKTQEQQHT